MKGSLLNQVYSYIGTPKTLTSERKQKSMPLLSCSFTAPCIIAISSYQSSLLLSDSFVIVRSHPSSSSSSYYFLCAKISTSSKYTVTCLWEEQQRARERHFRGRVERAGSGRRQACLKWHPSFSSRVVYVVREERMTPEWHELDARAADDCTVMRAACCWCWCCAKEGSQAAAANVAIRFANFTIQHSSFITSHSFDWTVGLKRQKYVATFLQKSLKYLLNLWIKEEKLTLLSIFSWAMDMRMVKSRCSTILCQFWTPFVFSAVY